MNLDFISDIHLETRTEHNRVGSSIINPTKPILILAGDIGKPESYLKDFLQYCTENWKHVLYVAGNHEYYGGIKENITRSVILSRYLFVWLENNSYHRIGGPANIKLNQGRYDKVEWYIKGKLHRTDGPAVTRWSDGVKIQEEWYLNGGEIPCLF